MYKNVSDILVRNKTIEDRGITFINSEDNEEFLSYKNLYNDAIKLLCYFQENGISAGNELIFEIDNNKQFIEVFWACILGGIIPVPLALFQSNEDIDQMLKIYDILDNPKIIISQNNVNRLHEFCKSYEKFELNDDLYKNIILLNNNITKYETNNVNLFIANEDDLALVQFSSGSTGDPKGVMLTHKQIITNAHVFTKRLGIESDDSMLCWAPLSHDMGLLGAHLSMAYKQINQYLIPVNAYLNNPLIWLTKISKYGVTFTMAPNFGFRYICNFLGKSNANLKEKINLSTIKGIVNGGEPISLEVCNKFLDDMSEYKMKRNVMLPAYGLAEATLVVTLPIPGKEIGYVHVENDSINIGERVKVASKKGNKTITLVQLGHLLDRFQLKICDDYNNEVEEMVVGHVCIKGDCITNGYYKNPKATSDIKLENEWIRTGDIGLVKDGELILTGRYKDIVIIKGKNYYYHDIERVIEKIEGIVQGKFAVGKINNGDDSEEKVAVFIEDKKENYNINEFIIKIKEKVLNDIGIIVERIIFIDKLPKTSSGKIQRHKLMSNIKNTVPKKEKCFDLKKIEDFLIETCSKLLNNKKISIEEKFFDMGMNSLMLTKLVGNINSVYDIKLDVVDLFLYVNIKSLSDYICNGIEKDSSSITVNEDIKSDDNKYIAIIGMAAKLPGSKDIYEFWENLKRGKDTITRFTDEELIESGIDEKVIKSPNYVKAKGIIEDELSFDYSFFGYSPYEAKNMDPQMRILHEYVWAALEDAGYRTSDYEGLIGCFVGSGSNYNWNVNAYREPCDLSEQIEKILLTEKDYFATRMAYKLDFRGPSYAVQSACSSSLSGVNVACKSLLSNECDIGVVAGVSVSLPVNSGYMYNEGSMLSKDGKCKVFDNNATGTIFSDGIGVVVLKRLDDAIRDGDNIYAVIKGIASNNDGNRRSGYTAPSIEGQRDVILAAQKAAQVEADTVSYIEAHGTGTLLGDPIEIKGLKSVFKSNKENTCAIGSVKANIGHLNSTSGVASLIKTALAIKNKQIPPQINFDNLNDKIDFKNTPFYINTELSKWNNLKDSQGNEIPLRAGISSFGFGGTNVHAILEEVKKNHNAEDYEQTRESYLLVLSAKNVKSLDSITRKMYEYLNKNPEVNLWNIVRTLQSGREEFNLRKAYEVSNLGEIKDLMLEDIQGRSCNKLISGVNNKENLVFMFTGQGSQYIDMGLELYQKEKYFRDEMDKCFKILDNFVSYNLKEILYPKTNKEINMEKLKETNKTQLAVFIFEYSLARLLMKWGIQPDIMIGHSLGEYVAACLSGVFSLEDAIKVLIKRGELMSKIPRGIMISLNLNYIEAKELMKGFKLTLSVVNSESSCVVSGDNENIKRFQELLDIKGIEGKVLRTSHAFHSHMMDPILNEFENYFDEIRFGKVNIPYISNLTGQEIKNEEATSGEYWKRHLRETVRFDKGINNLMGTDNNVFIEIGPGNALTSLAKKAKNSENQVIINVIRHQKEDISDVKYLNRSIGRAWCSGVRINWSEYNNKAKYNKVSLPTYQFVRNIFKYNNNFDMKYLKLNSNDSIDDDEFQEDKTEFYLRSNYVEPKTEIEKQVASIWREILGVKIISIKDSFFELGGESLYAAKIVNRIKERLNIVVPINMLFEYKTIEEFSKYISSLDKNKVISMEKSEEREYYLASSQEKRMYLQQMSDKDSSLLNVTGVLEVKGKLNVENVDNAFKEIIKRHEALRSSFGIKDGQVVQKVLAADKVNFKVNKVECNKEENLNNIIKNLIKPFDLEKGKLINVSVIKRKDDLWILIIDVHHIATDMTSMKIIYNEFGKLYSGELLKDVLYQYKDYSKWQIDEHKKENYKKQEEYWLKEFEGNLPTMDLKAANKRSAVRDYKGKLAILKIDEKKTKKLKSLAQEEDSTLYMVLLACMNIFLYKYSGEKDIIIGTPIAGRSQPDLENIVGMFINTVCIRTIINESKSFKEYLEKVKVKTIRAFENQDYQFDEVISKLKIKREPGRNPLFDIMFVLQEMPKIQIKNLEFIEYEFEKNQEMFDMSFVAREENGEITFYVTYAEGLFDSNFVQDMLERYESIIDKVLNNKHIIISNLDLITEKEYEKYSEHLEEKEFIAVDFDF